MEPEVEDVDGGGHGSMAPGTLDAPQIPSGFRVRILCRNPWTMDVLFLVPWKIYLFACLGNTIVSPSRISLRGSETIARVSTNVLSAFMVSDETGNSKDANRGSLPMIRQFEEDPACASFEEIPTPRLATLNSICRLSFLSPLAASSTLALEPHERLRTFRTLISTSAPLDMIFIPRE